MELNANDSIAVQGHPEFVSVQNGNAVVDLVTSGDVVGIDVKLMNLIVGIEVIVVTGRKRRNVNDLDLAIESVIGQRESVIKEIESETAKNVNLILKKAILKSKKNLSMVSNSTKSNFILTGKFYQSGHLKLFIRYVIFAIKTILCIC